MCSGRGLHYGPKVALGDEESQSDSRGKAIQCKGISCILKNGHLSGELDFVLSFVRVYNAPTPACTLHFAGGDLKCTPLPSTAYV